MKRTPLLRRSRIRPVRRPKAAAVHVYPSGREVCQKNAAGEREYDNRTMQMLRRQGGVCCICGLYLSELEATFEHEDGRGMGGARRDDRIEVDGKWQNGAAHPVCNTEKGSRRMDYSSRFQPCPKKEAV